MATYALDGYAIELPEWININNPIEAYILDQYASAVLGYAKYNKLHQHPNVVYLFNKYIGQLKATLEKYKQEVDTDLVDFEGEE